MHQAAYIIKADSSEQDSSEDDRKTARPMRYYFSQSASQSVSQSVSQPVSQSVSQSVSQPASQPASQPVSQSGSKLKFISDTRNYMIHFSIIT